MQKIVVDMQNFLFADVVATAFRNSAAIPANHYREIDRV